MSDNNLFGWEESKLWEKEWVGMPEFVQEDLQPVQQIIVSFEDEEDVHEFSKLINQKLSELTKSVWYPEQDKEKPSTFMYVQEHE